MTAHRLDYPIWDFADASGTGLLKWQEHFNLDDRKISRGLGSEVDDVGADLLDVAVAVYVVDRLCRRRPVGARRDGQWWHRSLAIRLPLRSPSAWLETGAHETLLKLLAWLTDDRWEVRLEDGLPRRSSDGQSTLFPDHLDRPVAASLFSGGLDSLLGADQDLQGPGELVLVAAGTNGRMIGLQRDLVDGLSQIGPRRVRLVSLPVWLTAAGKKRLSCGEESSQRTRGLLFASMGAVVARAAGTNRLQIHENGPGSLNLPMSSGQFGSMNTRAARPETLRMLGTMFSQLFGEPFELVNPSFWKTKAEMCREARRQIDPLITKSVTCDTGLTRRVSEGQLCGYCTSCLLRRQALIAAGRSDLDDADRRQMIGDALAAQRQYAKPTALAMVSQAADMSLCLSAGNPWSALVHRWPDLISVREALDVDPAQLVALLERYVTDWEKVRLPVVREMLPLRVAA